MTTPTPPADAPTPRTDEQPVIIGNQFAGVPIYFAKMLERELAAKDARIAALEKDKALIFEVVDSSDDERYWTLGVFVSEQEAMALLDHKEPPYDENFGGSVTYEVRERKTGFRPHDYRTVASRTWVRGYEENEPEWKAEPIVKSALDAAREGQKS